MNVSSLSINEFYRDELQSDLKMKLVLVSELEGNYYYSISDHEITKDLNLKASMVLSSKDEINKLIEDL